ncbi:unnamed protein product [Symbiodinium sp. CCMP2592]|nr:unnamed protein product [Symbiodinium sp. CCMP2592]
MIRPTGPKPKHESRTCLQAADALPAVTMPSLSCVSRSECEHQKQACKQQHASQAYDCNKVKLNNSGTMEMCAQRLGFKRTVKSQKLILAQATTTNPSASTLLLHFLPALNITQPPRLLPKSLYRKRGPSSCMQFPLEAANHDMSTISYYPHHLS